MKHEDAKQPMYQLTKFNVHNIFKLNFINQTVNPTLKVSTIVNTINKA